MWSKIKHRHIPISIKLTMLHAFILMGILLFTSLLTIAGLLYVLFTQAHDDLKQSTIQVAEYLKKNNTVDSHLLDENLLLAGVTLKLYDEQNSLIVDSAPHVASAPPTTWENEGFENHRSEALRAELSQLFNDDETYFFEIKKQFPIHGHLFKLHLMKPMLEQSHFLKHLILNLLITNMIGLIIAIVSGIYLSHRILKPIRTITKTAQEIEIKNLEKRIPLTGNKDELQELSKTFNGMLDRLQAGFEKQRRFASDASHELRTPITVISGYAEMLDRWGKQDPAALQEGIDAIKSEATSMYALIEKLLFLAKTDQNRQILKKIPLDTQPLIEELFQETCIIAPTHKIVLIQNDAASICADAASIKQLLRIFIENSIKYTPAEGTIQIEAKKTTTHLEVTVKDTGIGIPAEEQAHVFHRFYRVDKSRSKITGGTGLGLSIAKWIAAQHDSSINLDSSPGAGTAITVCIPLITSNPPKAANCD